jgi:hypothetical protein
VQDDARQAFRQFQQDPHHPGWQFKSVLGTISGKTRKLWSIRKIVVGSYWNALSRTWRNASQ